MVDVAAHGVMGREPKPGIHYLGTSAADTASMSTYSRSTFKNADANRVIGLTSDRSTHMSNAIGGSVGIQVSLPLQASAANGSTIAQPVIRKYSTSFIGIFSYLGVTAVIGFCVNLFHEPVAHPGAL